MEKMEELGNFEELQEENEKLRKNIEVKINELIENEIQQERLCNQ